MLTDIVVLYMAYMFEFPTWCKMLPTIAITLKLIQFGYGICKGLENVDQEKECEDDPE